MRQGNGIVGATLLFDPSDKPPDLVLAMQYLIDDLRAEGRRIAAMKLTPSTLRLRADPYEVLLTVAPAPIGAGAMQGLLRPPFQGRPDFARVRLTRALRIHTRAMGVLVRRRGAPIPDPCDAVLALTREGKFALAPVLEAATPALVIWQPGGLVLTLDEFRHADAAFLLQPGDPALPLTMPPAERLGLPRPDADPAPPNEQAEDHGQPPPHRQPRRASRPRRPWPDLWPDARGNGPPPSGPATARPLCRAPHRRPSRCRARATHAPRHLAEGGRLGGAAAAARRRRAVMIPRRAAG